MTIDPEKRGDIAAALPGSPENKEKDVDTSPDRDAEGGADALDLGRRTEEEVVGSCDDQSSATVEQIRRLAAEAGVSEEEAATLASGQQAEIDALRSETLAALENERTEALVERVDDMLSPEDSVAFHRVIEAAGGPEKLFDPKDTFLHTTSDLSFAEMLKSGNILTDEVTPSGRQRTPGASFTDGNFPEAAAFQLLYDNIPGGGKEKELNSERYADELGGTHAENFIRYFWKNHREEAMPYLTQLASKIPEKDLAALGLAPGEPISGEEQALAVGKHFTPQGKGEFGVTIVFDAKRSEELGIEDRGTVGLQKFFEKRSFKPGGVPLSEASALLVPSARIPEVRQALEDKGLGDVEVRGVEELEARMMMEKMEQKEG